FEKKQYKQYWQKKGKEYKEEEFEASSGLIGVLIDSGEREYVEKYQKIFDEKVLPFISPCHHKSVINNKEQIEEINKEENIKKKDEEEIDAQLDVNKKIEKDKNEEKQEEGLLDEAQERKQADEKLANALVKIPSSQYWTIIQAVRVSLPSLTSTSQTSSSSSSSFSSSSIDQQNLQSDLQEASVIEIKRHSSLLNIYQCTSMNATPQ
ncbi:MAG: hypothetical protein EZS28_055223, partial [Streblomastix strix]